MDAKPCNVMNMHNSLINNYKQNNEISISSGLVIVLETGRLQNDDFRNLIQLCAKSIVINIIIFK